MQAENFPSDMPPLFHRLINQGGKAKMIIPLILKNDIERFEDMINKGEVYGFPITQWYDSDIDFYIMQVLPYAKKNNPLLSLKRWTLAFELMIKTIAYINKKKTANDAANADRYKAFVLAAQDGTIISEEDYEKYKWDIPPDKRSQWKRETRDEQTGMMEWTTKVYYRKHDPAAQARAAEARAAEARAAEARAEEARPMRAPSAPPAPLNYQVPQQYASLFNTLDAEFAMMYKKGPIDFIRGLNEEQRSKLSMLTPGERVELKGKYGKKMGFLNQARNATSRWWPWGSAKVAPAPQTGGSRTLRKTRRHKKRQTKKRQTKKRQTKKRQTKKRR